MPTAADEACKLRVGPIGGLLLQIGNVGSKILIADEGFDIELACTLGEGHLFKFEFPQKHPQTIDIYVAFVVVEGRVRLQRKVKAQLRVR
jgi:hypothetical protein